MIGCKIWDTINGGQRQSVKFCSLTATVTVNCCKRITVIRPIAFSVLNTACDRRSHHFRAMKKPENGEVGLPVIVGLICPLSLTQSYEPMTLIDSRRTKISISEV